MRILMVSSELAPLARTGDLGDAVGALARGLARRGHDVVAVLPDYGSSNPGRDLGANGTAVGPLGEVPTTTGPQRMFGWMMPSVQSGLRVVRLNCPALYDRPGLYGAPDDFSDNPDRFWSLAVGAVAAARRLEFAPEVAHGHDWHAGWLAAVLRSQPDFAKVRTVHTGYDLRMPGAAPLDWGRRLGVVSDLLTPEGIEYFGHISFAKVGLRFADVVAMSAPDGYDPPEGLTGVVQARGAAVTRIPRSVDAVAQDPANDLALPARYSAEALAGKQTCKRRLQAALGLEMDSAAFVILHTAASPPPCESGDRLVQWVSLQRLSGGLLRLAFAGADALYEPSGDPWSAASRMAERYGLATICPAGPEADPSAYTFGAGQGSFAASMARMLSDFDEPDRWQEVVQSKLRRDPELGVARYETLYRQVVGQPVGPPVCWAQPALVARMQELGR